MCQSAVSAFLSCRFVRELGAAKRAVLPDVPHQTARSSAEAYRLRGWKTVLREPDAPDLWSGHPYGLRWTAAPCCWIAGQKRGSAA